MSKTQQLLILGISLSLSIAACSNSDSGDKFLGNWVRSSSSSHTLTITKAGETAYSIVHRAPSQDVGRWTATYEKGNLINGTMFGSIIISYSNGKIIYKGEEYEKTK